MTETPVKTYNALTLSECIEYYLSDKAFRNETDHHINGLPIGEYEITMIDRIRLANELLSRPLSESIFGHSIEKLEGDIEQETIPTDLGDTHTKKGRQIMAYQQVEKEKVFEGWEKMTDTEKPSFRFDSNIMEFEDDCVWLDDIPLCPSKSKLGYFIETCQHNAIPLYFTEHTVKTLNIGGHYE